MKSIYVNDKGYGVYTEEYKMDVWQIDGELKRLFEELMKKEYRPNEVCLDLINSLFICFCEYSILQRVADRGNEKV